MLNVINTTNYGCFDHLKSLIFVVGIVWLIPLVYVKFGIFRPFYLSKLQVEEVVEKINNDAHATKYPYGYH